MGDFTYVDNANPAYIEGLYEQYKENPDSVDPYWKKFFDGFEFAIKQPGAANGVPSEGSSKEVAVVKLINAYRSRGHLIADTNPVRERRRHKSDLELDYFGLTEADLDQEFDAGQEISIGRATLRQILDHLRKTYCGSIGVEYMYCRNEQLRQWLYLAMEPGANQPSFSTKEKKHILKKISQAVLFENFLHTKYVGKKRFSLEGVESLIPALDEAIRESANLGAKEFTLGMAHRGRLNVLAHIFGKDYEEIFSEFEGTNRPAEVKGDGDVKYHLGRSDDIVTEDGKEVHLTLVPNPSHLEAVNPVVQGLVYAKQEEVYDGDDSKVIPIVIHGDAAISGQGINYEAVNMSKIEGYSVGGSVHIVTNNQLGFTTSYQEARSSVYCTDIAKVTESPVFHVNADDPEAVVYAMKLAIRIRMKFNIDVYVDILGYRKYGHNEGDEPRFTQPMLYKLIDKHKGVRDIFLEKLLAEKAVTSAEVDEITKKIKDKLQSKLDKVKKSPKKVELDSFGGNWKGLRASKSEDFDKSIETGVSKKVLDKVAKALLAEPKDIEAVRKVQRLLKSRNDQYNNKKAVDWGLAELLAYGTLLTEDMTVRISGQDAQRGTFSHRHAVMKDANSETPYIALNNIQKKQGKLSIYNSLLSEYCVMGFEFGYSWGSPKSLVVWEAQFGDFSNGAQIIIDQFVSSCESKWHRFSGLMLYLPHGYEGQGPEHSSARPERYLQLCAEDNMYVINATTPANFFHLIRRQMKNPFRIPTVLMTPKSLLRHPKVVSDLTELEKGRFQELIDDADAKAGKTKRVVMCSGKIYYDLLQHKEDKGINDVAIVRLEQLYPLPMKQLTALKSKYKSAKEWIWAQEEPGNMGYWGHILRHLGELFNFRLVSRRDSASPATSLEKEHLINQAKVVEMAIEN